jgi:transcription-repair coupling factor (superfamily II helicase)
VRLLEAEGAAGAYLVARMAAEHAGPVLWIAPAREQADRTRLDLAAFVPPVGAALADATPESAGVSVWSLPAYDTPPFDRFSPQPEVEAQRMSALYRLLASRHDARWIAVTTWEALVRRVLPRAELRARVTHLERGLPLSREALVRSLLAAGYHHRTLVEASGEVASRGSIVDFFPPQLDRPVRLELDYDEIHSIRTFDPLTQRSESELRDVVAIPPRGPRVPADREAAIARIRTHGKARGLPEASIYALTEAIWHGRLPQAAENIEALLQGALDTVFDYLPASTLIVIDDPEAAAAERRRLASTIASSHERARQQDRLTDDVDSLYVTDEDAVAVAYARRPLLIDPLGATGQSPAEERVRIEAPAHRELSREIEERKGTGHALEPLATRLSEWIASGHSVRLACTTLSAAERLCDILLDYQHALRVVPDTPAPVEPGTARVEVARISRGFELPAEGLVVVTEQDLFGARLARRPPRRTRKGLAIERLAQVDEGDLLVHAEHGIGRYGGLTQLSLGGVPQEMLLLLYENNDKLYVPVANLDRVQRYAGAEDTAAKLDRLGGTTWTRTRTRVRKNVREIARELLAVVAARETLEGTAYPPPGADYEEFEARFPYEDTPDQRRATDEVLADLQKPRPMDRVVCGDVGFGKTEIACRAAYHVIASGRQVAVLVPTTVLCRQHGKTFGDRFAELPIEVRTLSRLQSRTEMLEIQEGLATGRIDLVIGTHRLLAKDIQWKQLGLIVVDEEHRFGVVHKERLKQLRKLVDVLTLSATPIPRTLQMALSGMRDLSVMMTPPPDRVAIRSEVCRLSDDVLRDAIHRELDRAGQVFVVHNRVETIDEFSSYVRTLVPNARIASAHGQMRPAQLERVMLSFVDREIDVLVCTAIIESGLDIPNANTILIHRADRFGLAQLYQLRGRVGRSDRRAHAYFLLPAEGQMTPDAKRRIEAIQDLTELGAGFRLASEDLEIRGAGNLLGAQQSGQIASVGYDMYLKMLDEAIAELRGQPLEAEIDPEIRLPIPALLPDTFVPEPQQRLLLYKQLSSARTPEELREGLDDILDRYGPLPVETRNLADILRLRMQCRALGIERIETAQGELVLRAHRDAKLDGQRLLTLISQPQSPWRVTQGNQIHARLRKVEDALAEAQGLLELLERKPVEQAPPPPDPPRRSRKRQGISEPGSAH